MQCLASELCKRGVTNMKLCDASMTQASYLIADMFRLSHIVLASPTYNLSICPVMDSLLSEMKMQNLQNRHIALVENGSWACPVGDLMEDCIDENMKDIEVLNERLSMSSSLPDLKGREAESLAQAIADSVEEVTCDCSKRFEKKQKQEEPEKRF